MMNTYEIQVAPGSRSLARQLQSKKRSGWFYNLRQFKRSQRQGGLPRVTGGGSGPPRSRRGALGSRRGALRAEYLIIDNKYPA